MAHTASHTKPIDFSRSLDALCEGLTAPETEVVKNALHWIVDTHETSQSHQWVIDYGCGAANILRGLGLDYHALAATIICADETGLRGESEKLKEKFGGEVTNLVDGATQMSLMPVLSGDLESAREVSAENLRRMLIAMVNDVRVVLIKLALHLQSLRSIKDAPGDARQKAAREALDVYAPLANRLGVWQFKWEMEDWSLRYLHPESYHTIAAKLAERRADRENYIDAFVATLKKALTGAGVEAEVYGRPKHIYSIWRKMQRKDTDFENIYDVRAVRVLVNSVADCYSALGVVHTNWRHIAGEFDDYIATPKENNYQSIHSAIVGPDGKVVEVQIRTYEMHESNELGVAAHWHYKENVKRDKGVDSKVLWLRQLLEWKDELPDTSELRQHFRDDVFDQRVYVFTPRGEVMDLPKESTPVDFAYAVHTEVGHRCRGAKVNGKIVPLNHQLQNGERVEILTVKKGGPSRDWMSPHLGYLHTSRARARVARWFKEENYDENVAAGRVALDRELHRLGVSDVSFEKLANHLDYKKVDDFLAAIGCGDLKTSRAVSLLKNQLSTRQEPELPTIPAARKRPGSAQGVEVLGVGNLLTHMANCCRPLPGDEIIGYITRTRGVTIHRRDCANMLRLQDAQWDRFVEVEWGDRQDVSYPVDVSLKAYDRNGLLHDITTVLTDANIGLQAVDLKTDKTDGLAFITLTLDISDIEKLSQVLGRISRVPNVIDVRRITH